VNEMAYGAFGEINTSVSGSGFYDFTGQQQWTVAGTSGIDDFPFRKYSPVQGRWVSPDPAGMAAVDITNPQTWNRYAYLNNNPLNAVDPLGLYLCDGEDDGWDDECDGGDDSGGDGGAVAPPTNVGFCTPGSCSGETGDPIFVSDPTANPIATGNLSTPGEYNGNVSSQFTNFITVAVNDVGDWFHKAKLVGVGGSFWIPVKPGVGWSPGGNAVSDGTHLHVCGSLLAGGFGAKTPGGSFGLLFGQQSKAVSIIQGWSVSINANTPFYGLGAQVITSSTGTLAGPSFGTPGVSFQIGYGGPCAP